MLSTNGSISLERASKTAAVSTNCSLKLLMCRKIGSIKASLESMLFYAKTYKFDLNTKIA